MATTNKRLKKNISFSPSEKDIYDFLTEQPNASSLIKELVLRYMIEIGVYKDLKDRAMKVYAKDYSNFVVNMSTPKLNIKKRNVREETDEEKQQKELEIQKRFKESSPVVDPVVDPVIDPVVEEFLKSQKQRRETEKEKKSEKKVSKEPEIKNQEKTAESPKVTKTETKPTSSKAERYKNLGFLK